ncbi:hypothetical protein HK1_02438 [Tepidibacillus sp. HK-1]|nr:hypothetical protein HK1_02438 [Tepidibacillus sp. HK-1]
MKLKYFNDNDDKYIRFIEEVGIPYLEEKQTWKELSESAEHLADYYANQHFYKKSCYYYRLAIDSRKKFQM